jgi:hypothetical protein
VEIMKKALAKRNAIRFASGHGVCAVGEGSVTYQVVGAASIGLLFASGPPSALRPGVVLLIELRMAIVSRQTPALDEDVDHVCARIQRVTIRHEHICDLAYFQ